MDRPWTARSGLVFVAGLLVACAAVAWQTVSVFRAPYPRLRAAVVLALSFPGLILAFATAYVLISQADRAAFSEPLGRLGSLYFTMTVFTTVGFGDISPQTAQARSFVLVQMLLDLIYIGFLVRALTVAARLGIEHRARGHRETQDTP